MSLEILNRIRHRLETVDRTRKGETTTKRFSSFLDKVVFCPLSTHDRLPHYDGSLEYCCGSLLGTLFILTPRLGTIPCTYIKIGILRGNPLQRLK